MSWYQNTITGEWFWLEPTTGIWYHYSQGKIYPMAVTGEEVEVVDGSSLRVSVSFRYFGPVMVVTIEASVGQYRLGIYDRILIATKNKTLPESATPIDYTEDIIIPITTALGPTGTKDLYSLAAWIQNYKGETETHIDYCIRKVGIEPTFSDFIIVSYGKLEEQG